MTTFFDISVSLDGYVAGPNPSLEVPLGEGGEQLHEWAVPTKTFNERHGRSGGEPGMEDDLLRDVFERTRRPWFQFGAAPGGRVIGEDVWFSNGVLQAGLEIVCDGSLHCSHVKDGMDLLKLAGW